MRGYYYWLAVALLAVGLVFIFSRQGRIDSRPLVVTTSTPASLIVEELLGDDFRLVQLIPNGQEIHDFQPTPSTISNLAEADLLVSIGAGLETSWLDDLTSDLNLNQLIVSQEAELRDVELIHHDEDDHDSDSEHSHDHGEIDPHLWLSPQLILKILPSVESKLSEISPNHSQQIRVRAVDFSQRLTNLDNLIMSEVDNFQTKKFIASHEAFSYFARDYDLKQVGSLAATPGEVLTPGTLDEIARLIEQENLKGIFVEPGFGEEISRQLAEDLSLELEFLNPLEVRPSNKSYVSLMEDNLSSLIKLMGSK
ncbi:zinc ABC transporter substrate-binding protein [Candidatus Berkelbacteria bacterium]|nr:zinc ABC transporter substrate-binding protein [Candidatus Berkelbacteria bacterium]